jgi:hypothetical protein
MAKVSTDYQISFIYFIVKNSKSIQSEIISLGAFTVSEFDVVILGYQPDDDDD